MKPTWRLTSIRLSPRRHAWQCLGAGCCIIHAIHRRLSTGVALPQCLPMRIWRLVYYKYHRHRNVLTLALAGRQTKLSAQAASTYWRANYRLSCRTDAVA